jgi:hypothetical protein
MRRLEDNIRIVLRELVWEVVDWMHFRSLSGSGPVMGSCEHGNEPLVSIKGGKFHGYLE